jgi:cobalt transport protein
MVIKRIALALMLVFFLFMWWIGEGSRAGTDDRAKEMVASGNQSYHPWYSGVWSGPSANGEKLLFALQGASGCVLGAYCLFRLSRIKKDPQP